MKRVLFTLSIFAFLGSCTMPADYPTNSAESPENSGPSMPAADTTPYSGQMTNSQSIPDSTNNATLMPAK